MNEIKEIVRAFDAAQSAGLNTALATIVRVEGSSYRQPGARMLITENGQLTGAISGGCLEGDALRKARLVILQKKAMLVTYDTLNEDDAKVGLGLGCNGIIHILIEPINTETENNPLNFLKIFLSARQPLVLITFFNFHDRQTPQYGTCIAITETGKMIGSPPEVRLSSQVIVKAKEAFKTGRSILWNCEPEKELNCFVELIKPPVSLVIIGAGNDAVPVCEIAAVLGWDICIADGRPAQLSPERFPKAGKLILSKAPDLKSQLVLDNRTAVIFMSHNFNYDSAGLLSVIDSGVTYIGMLGPKKRTEKILNEINQDSILTDNQVKKIYSPVGLDLGAENAAEIALSIISEIQSVFAKRDGTQLRTKNSIHTEDTWPAVFNKENFA